MNIYSLNNISYNQKDKTILDNISFEVNKGDKIAIIGHNGSGKTTLQEILLGNIKPTSGSIIATTKSLKIGIIYDSFSFLPLLKVKEIIKYFTKIYGIDNLSSTNNLLKEFDLLKLQNSHLKSLSQGEKKKVSILLALLNNPDILIMDEPFANIDPIYISTLLNYIFTESISIIYSTNDWDIIKNNETKILMISKGMQVGTLTSITELQKQIPSPKKVVVENIDNIIKEIIPYQHYIKDNHIHIFIENPSLIMNNILKYSNNISILPTGIIDYYLLNQEK